MKDELVIVYLCFKGFPWTCEFEPFYNYNYLWNILPSGVSQACRSENDSWRTHRWNTCHHSLCSSMVIKSLCIGLSPPCIFYATGQSLEVPSPLCSQIYRWQDANFCPVAYIWLFEERRPVRSLRPWVPQTQDQRCSCFCCCHVDNVFKVSTGLCRWVKVENQ